MSTATQQSTETNKPWQIFGHIPGIAPGKTFADRLECAASNVHRPRRRGISGSQEDGAWSICISGGYKENRDQGNTIVYSGEGRGESSGKRNGGFPLDDKQHGNQEWIRGNQALRTSYRTGKPVRVVRGAPSKNYDGQKSIYTPISGCRYDGLYTVVDCRETTGEDGFMVCVFTLTRNPDQTALPTNDYWAKTSHLMKKKKQIMRRETEYPSTIKKRTAVQANAAFAERPDSAQRALKRQRKAKSSSSSSLPKSVEKRQHSQPSASSQRSPPVPSGSSIEPIDDEDDDEQRISPPARSASSGARPNPGSTGVEKRRNADSSFTRRNETCQQTCRPYIDTRRSLELLDGVMQSLSMRDMSMRGRKSS